jgi:TolB-like protein
MSGDLDLALANRGFQMFSQVARGVSSELTEQDKEKDDKSNETNPNTNFVRRGKCRRCGGRVLSVRLLSAASGWHLISEKGGHDLQVFEDLNFFRLFINNDAMC